MSNELVLIPGLNNTRAVFDGVLAALPPTLYPHAVDCPPIDSVEGIAHEKAAIFDGLVPGGVAIFNADIATTPILRASTLRSGTGRSPQVRTLPEVGVRMPETILMVVDFPEPFAPM